MGKSLETKKSIICLLILHKPTFTDITRHMGKSFSTIKRHLEAMRDIGAVQHVNELHLARYKYYECMPYAKLDPHSTIGNGEHGNSETL